MLTFDPLLLVMLVAIVFFGFYVGGTIWGKRRVAQIAKAVVDAVVSLGGRSVSGRSGVSAAVLSFRNMGNLTEFSVVVGITSWANPFTYAISKAMKRKDLIILRAKTSTPPHSSFAIIRKDSPAQRYAKRWGLNVVDVDDYLVATNESTIPEIAKEVVKQVKPFPGLFLLSVSEELPHLQAYFSPAPFEDIKAILSILKKLI